MEVSALCMGTMTFAREADEAESRRLFDRCIERGVNFFDCANVYSRGEAERLLGRLIRGRRDELVLTSKVGFAMGDGTDDRGLSRSAILKQIDASLDRLGTDRLDVYFVHAFDEATPLAETLEALDTVVRQGKAVALGVSNFAAWQIAKARGICDAAGWSRFEVMQPMYNLLKRQAEVELLPMADSEAMGVIPYNPLAGGLLTGKYLAAGQEGARLTSSALYAKRYGEQAYTDITRRFVERARTLGVHPVTLAVAWVMRHPAVTAPILGARSVEQLEPALAAADLTLDEEVYRELNALSPEPPPATDRLEERR